MKNLLLLSLFIACFGFPACDQEAPSPNPLVVFSVDSTIGSMFATHTLTAVWAGADGKFVSLAFDNCLFQIEDELLYLYKTRHGNAVDLKKDDVFLYLNGKIHSAILNEKTREGFLNWLNSASPGDRKNLAALNVNLPEIGNALEPLKKLIADNPGIYLNFNDVETDGAKDLLAATQPEFFALVDIELVSMDLSRTITIYVEEDAEFSTAQLSAANLPALKHLILHGADEETVGDIVRGLPNLEFLSLSCAKLPMMGEDSQLKNLHVFCEDTADVTSISALTRLSQLNLMGNFENLQGLENIRKLRYLTLRGALQPHLAILSENNPDLLFLDISNTTIENLEFLSNVKKLQGLALPDAKALEGVSLEPIRSLAELRYIGLTAEIEDKAPAPILDEIRAVCPNCVIYFTQGFCLGSGWILLFLPLLALLLLVKKWRHA